MIFWVKHIFCILQGQNVQVTASKRWFLHFWTTMLALPRSSTHCAAFFLRFLFERFAGPDCCQSACARLRIKLWILLFLGNTKKHKKHTYAFPTTGPLRIENTFAIPSFFGGLIGNTHAFSRLFGKHISKN